MIDLTDQMQTYHPDLGQLRSVNRPSTVRIWIMAVISLALLVAVMLGALLTLDSLTALFGNTKAGASGPLICLGVSALCLALFGSFLISDFRKWSATRTVKLMIYQEGFTYQTNGQTEACRWGEIKDVNFRVIETHSKHSAPRKVRVIRSIVKSEGTVINLAETLNLIKITERIDKERKKL